MKLLIAVAAMLCFLSIAQAKEQKATQASCIEKCRTEVCVRGGNTCMARCQSSCQQTGVPDRR
jgi:uncharacterized membrane protein